MSSGGEHFGHANHKIGDAYQHVRIATCSACGKTEEIRDSKPGGLPVSAVAQKFRQRGWDIGGRRSNDLCPVHAKTPGALDRAGSDRRRRRAAYVAIKAKEDGVAHVTDFPQVLPVYRGPALPPVTIQSIAESLTNLGRVTVEPKVEPSIRKFEPAPAAETELSPRRLNEKPLLDLPVGVDVLIRSKFGGRSIKQTGHNKNANAIRAARNYYGETARLGVDFEVIRESAIRFGWRSLAKAETPQETITPEEDIIMPTPAELGGNGAPEAPAREFTPAERRKVLDALDTHYIGDERYKGDWSDKKLADHLDIPRILVAEIRGQFFGPDVNEAGVIAVRELKALAKDAAALMERHLTLAQDAELIKNRALKALGEA